MHADMSTSYTSMYLMFFEAALSLALMKRRHGTLRDINTNLQECIPYINSLPV